MESIDSLRAILHEIRPQLIKCIHDKKVKEYIEQYEQLHDGKKPNRKKIDDFNNILIAQKISVEEADKTIEECLQEVEKQIRKEQKKKNRAHGQRLCCPTSVPSFCPPCFCLFFGDTLLLIYPFHDLFQGSSAIVQHPVHPAHCGRAGTCFLEDGGIDRKSRKFPKTNTS